MLAGCGSVVVLGLESACCWWVRLVPRLEQACCWAEPNILGLVPAQWWVDVCPGVSGCRAQRVPGLVPVQWCVRLSPGPSGG